MPKSLARVLVVDECPDTADELTKALRARGYKVRAAPTASQALQAGMEFWPDVTLVSQSLPDMAGRILGEEFRRTPGLERSCLIAVGGGEPKTSGAGWPFDRCVEKPVDPGDVTRLLSELLTPGSCTAQSAPGTVPPA